MSDSQFVDDYLEFCAERGEQLEKPYSGKINLRLSPEFHQKASFKSRKTGRSLNKSFVDRTKKAVNE